MSSRYNSLPNYKYADVEGVSPVLEKSAGKPLRDYIIYGNSVQGDNLSVEYPQEIQCVGDLTVNLIPFPYFSNSQELNGITWTINEDGSIVANGTATANSTIRIMSETTIPIGNYVYCPNFSNLSLVSADKIFSYFYVSDKYYAVINNDGYKFNVESTLTQFVIALRVMAGTTVENFKFTPQLQEGVVATPYEPYGKYKIPVSISSDEFTTVTNVYLNEPLRKVENTADYIDYINQNVVRSIQVVNDTGTLSINESYTLMDNPVEEPIELPFFETYKHTNVVNVETTIQPSNVKIQYYKKG